MKYGIIAIISSLVFPVVSYGQELPPKANDLLRKLEEYKKSEFSKAQTSVDRKTKEVIVILNQIQSQAEQSGNTEGANAILKAIAGLNNGQVTVEPKRPIYVPKEAKYFRSSWFLLVEETTTHTKARQKANQMRGNLASCKSKETYDFLSTYIEGLSVWLGGTDKEVEGRWLWPDGSKFTFAAWAEGQPDNYWKSEHHLVMSPQGWNDYQTPNKPDPGIAGFIVEWPAEN